MPAERGAAGAALLLGAVLLAFGLPAAPAQRLACDVPFERASEPLSGFTSQVGCETESRSSQPSLRGPARLLFGLRLDLNRASQAALEALPAIGPARAGAIVRARARRRFDSLADLERVPGIGRKTRLGLQPWATVTSASDGASPGGAPAAAGGSQWIAR